MRNLFRAYVNQDLIKEPSGTGRLDGLTFSVKDVFSIKQYINTAGNPDWFRTHRPAEQNAAAIETLLGDGAKLIGTTHTDELMFSLNGENYHYGTPINPKAPDCIPGGSSSGSAVAVASEMVDFALGTDTGGSVRIPSAYCGLYGFRPTHGTVNIDGVIPLAESFDTVGWMARDSRTLSRVGEVLINSANQDNGDFTQVYLGEDAWELVDPDVKKPISDYLPAFETVIPNHQTVKISQEGLDVWADTFKHIQGSEIWKEHGDWIETEKPVFGPGISERFAWTSTINNVDLQEHLKRKKVIEERMNALLGENGILIIPTAPGPAPLRNLKSEELEDRRARTMRLTCIAGLAGLPQLTIPVAEVNGKPVALSVIANRHRDLSLLKLIDSIYSNQMTTR
ncbi:amidase [Aquibacillus halophilus]|uniref:Amidase n=1 Tax=Aquibacillus halophilus TaxID=930132 RepID=A0A6A8DT06_9BACI|nr:amidase [Aquibacillus halophilus]MRH44342.1 amidase [Aquibacillus halophilus]